MFIRITMKRLYLPVTAILLTLMLIFSSLPVMALTIPSATGKYLVTASSPSDDPKTGVIEVRPGEYVTVSAAANITYSGMDITSPPISIKTGLKLSDGSKKMASASSVEKVAPMALKDSKTYSMNGSEKIQVPASIKQGMYTLNCTASTKIGWMFLSVEKSAAKSFNVKVIANK